MAKLLAVDVAKEAADIVLPGPGLKVLVDEVSFGRATFANAQKYVFMATRAIFGNMFSMAGASLFLPFLPLFTRQILLTNLLTDSPQMVIAHVWVDEGLVATPRRWENRFIPRFMVVFCSLSSVFGFGPLPPRLILLLLAIVVACMASAQLLKRWFFRCEAGIAESAWRRAEQIEAHA